MNPSWKEVCLFAVGIVGVCLALPLLMVAFLWIMELAPK